MGDGIALLCMLYPETVAKQERCVDLLRHAAREYYRLPKAKCTTWSYFLPYASPWDTYQNSQPIIGGLEIYTSKKALQSQVDDPVFFQSYHETVKRENLYAKPEELVAWYLAGGFVARDGEAETAGSGNMLVSVTRLSCVDQGKVLEKMEEFGHWVIASEPGVHTYALFTRPKAPKELLIVVRYVDAEAVDKHMVAPEHVAVGKSLGGLLEGDGPIGRMMWREVDDSFASNHVGGGAAPQAKL